MTTTVDRCRLASDLSISRVLTGMWQIADMERLRGSKLDPGPAAEAMAKYAEAGFTTFDMADHYGSAEEIAGHFLHTYNIKAELFTKWVPTPGTETREVVREAVQRSLDRMRMDSLDCLQFHAWNYADPRWLDCLFWLQELKDEGLIRHLGLTNFDTAHLRIVLKSGFDIVSNQVCFSLVDRRAGEGMADLCEEHGIKILAFGTLAGAFLTDEWLGREEPRFSDLTTWSEMKYKRFIDAAGGWEPFQTVLQAVSETAKKHGVSFANVAHRAILEAPSVGGIIVGERLGESEHIEDNLNLFRFSLDQSDREAMSEAMGELEPVHGDCGDEYRKPPFLTASGDLSHHVETFPPPYPTGTMPEGRFVALSGTVWEEIAGFSRAICRGDRIWVSGTTAAHEERTIGGRDPAAQFHFIIDKIEGAIQSLGGRLEDVVRTRVFINNLKDWEPVARAHGRRFGHILPANTLVQAKLVGDGYLVEVEAEAVMEK